MGLIINSIKAGVETWRKGWISFILIVLLLSITFIPLIVISYLLLYNLKDVAGLILFSLLTFTVFIFYSFLQGMVIAIGKEIAEIEQGRAENIIYYIKKHGMNLILAGIVIYGLCIICSMPIFVLNNLLLNNTSTNQIAWILFSLSILIIIIFVNSIFSLSISAIIFNKLDVNSALKMSFNLFKKNSKPLLFVTVLFQTILWLNLSLLSLITFTLVIQNLELFFIILISIVLLFFIFPLMNLTYFHIFLKITLPNGPGPETKEEDIPVKII